MSQSSNDVFNHDDRTIDDDSKINRPQTEQRGGNSCGPHSTESNQHGKGNGGRGNQSRTEIAKQKKQQHDDEVGPFTQVVFDRFDHPIHQLSPIINHIHVDSGRKGLANFLIFRPQPVRHGITVLTHQHES